MSKKAIDKKAMDTATEVYNKLMDLYKSGNKDLDVYFSILEKFVTVIKRSGKPPRTMYTVFAADNNTYGMANTITSAESFIMFIEDCAMMIYRLYGAQDYTTPQLIEVIRFGSIQDTVQLL
jgi:hypothetical protein